MKKNLLLLLGLLFISLSLNAIDKLILIDLSKISNLNVLEELKINVVMQNNEKVLCVTEHTKSLDDNNIEYKLISDDIINDPVYILTSRIHVDISASFQSKNIVLNDQSQLIIKDNSLSELDLLKKNIKAVKIERTARLYKNEKTLYQNDIKNPLPVDQNVINYINADSIAAFVQHLQDFQTRYALHPNRFTVSEWIKNQFIRIGYTNVIVDSFYHSGYQVWQKNVVAVMPGSELTDQYVVIGGHHDSIVNSGYDDAMIFAPGADDNASGTAAVFEIARAMKLANYQSKTNIRFCTYAMEEFGLWGSKFDAYVSAQNQMKIRAMINNDMIASQISDNWEAHLQTYTGGDFLTQLAIHYIEQMPNLSYRISNTNTAGSDSWSYWTNGYPAIFLAESEFSPYYHSFNDITDYCNFPYAQQMVKLGASMLMYMSEIPTTPENFVLRNVGNGSQIQASWSAIPDIGDVDYRVTVYDENDNLVMNYMTNQTLIIVNNLTEGNLYKIQLNAIIDEVSSLVLERQIRPASIPQMVSNFHISPTWSGIQINWDANQELDVQNYRIYVSDNETTQGNLLTELPASTITYSTNPSNPAILKYYRMTCKDSDGNESEVSQAIGARPYTMGHGILVLDDTFNGTGTVVFPTDEQVDNYYNRLFSAYPVDQIELSSLNRDLNIFDLCAFSMVFYHRNTSNSSDIIPFTPVLADYLDNGGKLIISAYKPSQIFNTYPGYPANFPSGTFVRDYLKIQSSELNTAARFQSAQPLSQNYAVVSCDTTKTHINMQYRLKDIESLTPSGQGVAVYAYESGYDNSATQAVMDGQKTGVLYNGTDFKTLTLSFPLYQMKENEAQALINNTISLFGGINTTDSHIGTKPVTSYLKHNYPNPFNPVTHISYVLTKQENVEINIYNVKGQLLKSFKNGLQNPGDHQIVWDGTDDSSHQAPSGIYFYTLSLNGKNIQAKKMLLLK
ncbi:MAG TPA: M20/M25/M40 family metallo-hydrolase [Candidatus Cloacimonadota bacterium]|nr:M20/M25/M40 family metallo-hydrolase [Candidatus Cloacimonadota bacterium]